VTQFRFKNKKCFIIANYSWILVCKSIDIF